MATEGGGGGGGGGMGQKSLFIPGKFHLEFDHRISTLKAILLRNLAPFF